MFALKCTTPPAFEPLQVSDAIVKQHLRVIDTAEDALIALLISKAREAAELITRRALITQQWLLVLDKFPSASMETSSANWYGPSWGTGPGPLTTIKPEGQTLNEIYLPLPPLQSVESVRYYDATTSALTTLDPSQYIVDAVSEPGRLVPAPGTSWPATLNRINAVEVRFTAGYGADGSAVPAGIRDWVLMMAGTLYENRELVAVLNRGSLAEFPLFNGLLDAYRVIRY